MDALGLQILQSELLEDARMLAEAANKASARFAEDHPGHLEAAGYELHRFYNVLEKSFERICEAYENHFAKAGDYHEKLLSRMLLALPGIRPAFIAAEMKEPLRSLKGFRHLLRHAYDLELSASRMAPLVQHAQEIAAWFPARVLSFMAEAHAI